MGPSYRVHCLHDNELESTVHESDPVAMQALVRSSLVVRKQSADIRTGTYCFHLPGCQPAAGATIAISPDTLILDHKISLYRRGRANQAKNRILSRRNCRIRSGRYDLSEYKI